MLLQELQYFVTTAEHLNFTSAAKLLFITQSGLSKQIDRLEKELNVQLFVRARHAVSLTPAGKELLVYAKRFLYECNSLSAIDSDGNNASKRTLRVGISPHYGHFGTSYVKVFYEKFFSQIDDLELSIFCKDTSTMRSMLVAHQLDFAIASQNEIEQWDDMEHTVIIPRKRCVIMPESHPLAKRDSLKIDELVDEHFITVSRHVTPVTFDMIISLCTAYGFYPKIIKDAENFDALYTLVGMGQGITMAAVSPEPNSGVVAVEIDTVEYPDIGVLNAAHSDLAVAWNPKYSSPPSKSSMEFPND